MHTPTRRQFLRHLGQGALAAAGASLLSANPARAAEKKKWNFVFILADDLGWPDVVCYGKAAKGSVFSDLYETPNLDRLAAAGMRFTDAYAACPVCSPTRASIMTGQYPARIGLTEWIPGKRSTPREKVRAPKYLTKLPLELVTIPEALESAGYVSGHVGKWHLGGTGNLPEDQGFDSNVAGTHAGSPAGGYFLPNRMKLPGAKKGEYLTDRLSEEGAKFIAANKDKPFFLYQSYHSVHTPIQSKKAYAAKYQAKAGQMGKRVNAAYAGMLQSLDEGVGRIVKALDEAGIADRTVVFFMGDNGGLSGVTNNAPLRAGKGHVYEGGIREPMIIRAPGLVKPGSTCGVPVSSVDFYPTILDLAGTKGDPKHVVDGASLVPLLAGKGKLDRDGIYWHYPHYSPQGGRPAGAVRAGDFKLMELYEDNHLELYDLGKELGETTDLADTMPDKAAAMHKMLTDWRKAVGALMPTPNPSYDPKATRDRRKRPAPKPQSLAPGAKDKEFHVLTSAAVDAGTLGYALRAGGTGGVALKKLKTPLTRPAVLKCKIKSLQKDTSARAWRNGFLVFGDGAAPDTLVHAGMYLGGRRHYAIIQGTQGTSPRRQEAALTKDPYTEFEVEVAVDPAKGTAVMTTGGKKLTLKLAQPMKSITHVGYSATNTTTDFSPVTIAER